MKAAIQKQARRRSTKVLAGLSSLLLLWLLSPSSEHRIVAWLEARGAEFEIHNSAPDWLKQSDWVPRWVLSKFDRLYSVSVRGSQIDNEDVRRLCREATWISYLDLSGTPVSDAGVNEMDRLEQLISLDVSGTAVGDRGLRVICGCRHLQELDLARTRVTDSSIPLVGNFPKLEWLSLAKTRVTDLGVKTLRSDSLRILDLSSTHVTDESGRAISRLRSLEWVNVSHTKMTERGLGDLCAHHQIKHLIVDSLAINRIPGLTDLSELRVLSAAGSNISSEALHDLPQPSSLDRLDLSDTRVDDSAMGVLVNRAAELRDLSLRGTGVTDQGVRAIACLPHLYDLNLAHTSVSDQGLTHFRAMRFLANVNLSGTQVTSRGIQELQDVPLWELHLSKTKGIGSSWSIFPHLRSLDISSSDIVDNDLRGLAKLAHLEALVASDTGVTDKGVIRIGVVDSIRVLDLSCCRISNGALWSLSDLHKLHTLSLRGTRVADGLHNPLSLLQGLRVLDLRDTQLTSEGICQLAELSTLEKLYISKHGVEKAVRQLQNSLPHCEVRSAPLHFAE